VANSTALHSFNLKPTILDQKYELNSTIGRGSGSVVYKAFRIPEKGEAYHSDAEPVALKVLTGTERNPEEALKRIKKEARALISLNHPNVIRAYNYVARPDCCYLSLEYAEHGDLRRVIEKSKNKISVKSSIRITRSILRGLAHIHQNNIIHRDLKLENILVAKDLSIKITDFSIALLDGEKSDLNIINKFVGTLEYVAPECLKGQPYSVRSDLYSVGIIFYKLLTGEFPFEGQSISDSIELKSLGKFKAIDPKIIDEIPRIEDFLARILGNTPELRFANAQEAEEELLKISNPKENKIVIPEKDNGYVKPWEIFIPKPKEIKQFFSRPIIVIISVLLIFYGLAPLFMMAFSVSSQANRIVIDSNIERLLAQDLQNSSGLGILENLYSKDKHYRFSILPYEKDKALFSLGIKSWESMIIDLNALEEGGPITIEGKGISLIMRPDKKTGNKYEGVFQNLISGTKGRWTLSTI